MARIILYLFMSGLSTFCFCIGKRKAGIEFDLEYCSAPYDFVPIAMGVLWPIGWSIYAPYLAAIWVYKKGGFKK